MLFLTWFIYTWRLRVLNDCKSKSKQLRLFYTGIKQRRFIQSCLFRISKMVMFYFKDLTVWYIDKKFKCMTTNSVVYTIADNIDQLEKARGSYTQHLSLPKANEANVIGCLNLILVSLIKFIIVQKKMYHFVFKIYIKNLFFKNNVIPFSSFWQSSLPFSTTYIL